MKRELYLNASLIRDQEDFHNQMIDLFDLPHYYSRTLDDFWECLTSYINPNIRLIVHDFNNLIEIFNPNHQAIIDIFHKAPDQCPEMEILLN